MIENNEGSLERKLPNNVLNSLRIFALTSYLLYLAYTMILFVCFDMLFNNPLAVRMGIRNFYTQLISNLPLILLIVSLTSFIAWIFPFRRKFITRFYGDEMKTIWPGYSYYNTGQCVDVGLFVIIILFLPVYIITRILPFKATDNQIAARRAHRNK